MSLISFIFPVYNEEENINKLTFEVLKIKDQIKEDVEILFIDDGSKDKSYKILSELAKKYSFIKVISFSRNFGHEIALSLCINK